MLPAVVVILGQLFFAGIAGGSCCNLAMPCLPSLLNLAATVEPAPPEFAPEAFPEIREPTPPRREQVRRMHRILTYTSGILFVYFILAYVMMPFVLKSYVRHHPKLEDIPRVTHTSTGIAGDPLNVELVGLEDEIRAIMQAAGWYPAAHLGVKSDLRIAADTVLRRPYDEAPVSRLFLFGRKEDLAFEKPVGNNPSKRNHVRMWNTGKQDANGQPVWIGAATYDDKVGLSHTTGQITHHISGGVDAERDELFADLAATDLLTEDYYQDDFHAVREGKNGGGDQWRTDGRLRIGVIKNSAAYRIAKQEP